MAVTEVAATRDPGPPSESWLILQRLEDLSAQVKDIHQDMKELRREMRQELELRLSDLRREMEVRFASVDTRLDEMSRNLETYRRDNRVVLLAILGTWVTLFGTIVGLFFNLRSPS